MKDSYSFDVDDAGLDRSYAAHRDAYIRIFDRLGLDYVIVSALSGAMGGSKSEEFLTPAEVGEDTYVRCTNCDYAANVEALRTLVPPASAYDDVPAAHVEDTPDTPTIETLVALANARDDLRRDDREWTAGRHAEERRRQAAPPGRQDRAARHRPARRPRGRPEAARGGRCTRRSSSRSPRRTSPTNPGLVRGYIGPAALGADKPAGVRYLLDPRVVEGTRWITGANEPGRHVFDLVAGRDFTGDGTIEAASVREGDPCPNDDGGTLVTARGIEMGHIFQLGRKFADALDLKVLDENGKQVVVTMGSYGIGPSRAVAAIAEATLDDLGLCWPRAVAPADVHLVATGKDDTVFDAAQSLADDLVAQGLDVLYDDRRGVSPGVKFKDAELLGMPTIVVVGRGLADGIIEVRDRRTGEREDVAGRRRGGDASWPPSARDRGHRSRRSSSTGAAR